ncbi:META domain-containing protein [Cellulomonas sp. DKR-3]|uniref:META domain-containing protein n=1 Tax=Cellulomonas fulva TaxID=2835530 RepID=A0ABS5TZH6_9CELL|nr:META domain-containing protein [Cellulomonas fulva]MBT0994562.1 META domain-containing protein [Cellulomonas fulva]
MLRLVGRWRVTVRSRGMLGGPDGGTDGPGEVTPGLPEDDEDRTAELTFDGDGQVFGSGGVNRVRGTWSIEQDTLRFGPMVSTLMAGPATAMRQEAELLRLLRGPLGLRTPAGDAETTSDPLRGPDGAPEGAAVPTVELVAADGDRLVLERLADDEEREHGRAFV